MEMPLVDVITLNILNIRKVAKATELAKHLGLPTSTITNISDRLEKRGLIERVRDEHDHRVILLKPKAPQGEIEEDFMFQVQHYLEENLPELTPEWWCMVIGELSKLEVMLREGDNGRAS